MDKKLSPLVSPSPLLPISTDLLVGSSPQCWTRESISGRVGVYVEHNTWHAPCVQAGASNTACRSNRATSTNLQVQALRVQLSAIIVLPTVKSDDLVTDDIVSCFKILRQGHGDLELIFDERVRSPGAGVETRLSDPMDRKDESVDTSREIRKDDHLLGPLESTRSKCGAVT